MHRAVFASLILLALTFPAAADSLLQKAKSFSKDGPLYTFNMDYDDGDNRFQLWVDQSKPEGKRVVKLNPAASALKGEARKKADMLAEKTQGDIWCSDFAENIPASAKRVSETPVSATYRFTPLPGKAEGQIAGAYKYLTANAVIDKASGAILAFEMISEKAFKPVAVAKIEAFSMKVACAAAPDGRTHIASLKFDLKGSAMMQPLKQTETRRITNLKPLASGGPGAP